jgi:hypothetical protein
MYFYSTCSGESRCIIEVHSVEINASLFTFSLDSPLTISPAEGRTYPSIALSPELVVSSSVVGQIIQNFFIFVLQACMSPLTDARKVVL